MFVEGIDRMVKYQEKTPRTCTSLGIVQKTQLIECVRLHPCIWDTNHESFRSSGARQAAFNEIAQALSDQQHRYTRSHMQDEWGKIRYCFTRIIKKFLSTDDEAEAVSWPYWEKMQFMYEIIKDHLLSTGSACYASLGSTSFDKHMRSSRGRNRLSNHRFTPSLPGVSPNLLMTNNILTTINNQKHFTSVPNHASLTAEKILPKSVFDIADDEDRLTLADKYTKREEAEGDSLFVKRSKSGEGNQKNQEVSTQNFLSSLDSLPTPNNGVSSSINSLSTPQAGLITPTISGPQQTTLTTGEIVGNRAVDGVSLDNRQKEEDLSEYFGKYMVQQLKCISKRNPTLGIHLRKDMMELICKYELQAFSSP